MHYLKFGEEDLAHLLTSFLASHEKLLNEKQGKHNSSFMNRVSDFVSTFQLTCTMDTSGVDPEIPKLGEGISQKHKKFLRNNTSKL